LWAVLALSGVFGLFLLLRKLRARRLQSAVDRLARPFPVSTEYMGRSGLVVAGELLEAADAAFANGVSVVQGAAPNPPHRPSLDTPEELYKAMQQATSLDIASLTTAALDARLDQIAKHLSGSVLEFWRQAVEYWKQNPHHAVDTVVSFLKTVSDQSVIESFINAKNLLVHFEHLGAALTHNLPGIHHNIDAGVHDHLPHVDSFHHDVSGHDLGSHVANPPDSVPGLDVDGLDAGGIDGLDGGVFDSIDPGALMDFFPLITVLRSAIHEGRLLWTNKTTIGTSLKHVVLDGGSTMAGGAIGAAIGSAIFPGIGTVICGIAGSVLARFLGNSVKSGRCREAVKKYEDARNQFEPEYQNSVKRWYEAFEKRAAESRKRFLGRFSSFASPSNRREMDQIAFRLIDSVAAAYQRVVAKARALADSPDLSPTDRWYHLAFGLGIQSSYRRSANAAVSAQATSLEEHIRKVNSLNDNPARLRFLATVPYFPDDSYGPAVNVARQEIDALIAACFREFQIWLESASTFQAILLKESVEFSDGQRKKHEKFVEEWKAKLETLATTAKKECDKLG
jgi:hypothetical protein